MTVLKILLVPLLALIAAVVVLCGNQLSRSNDKPKRIWSTRLIVGGGLAGILFAFLSGVSASLQQGHLETLATQTQALITGGNSFVWLHPLPNPVRPGTFTAYLVHDGDNLPTFDVDIEFDTTTKCDKFQTWTLRDVASTGVNNPRDYFVPLFAPDELKWMPARLEPSCANAYYLAKVRTRSSAVIQQMLFRPDGNNWRISTRVLDIRTGAQLYRHTDPAASAVNWPDVTNVLKTLRRLQKLLKSK